MYSVHMKALSATEARKHWFRLLDEIVAGEVVVIERAGSLVELRRREVRTEPEELPDYSDILRVPDLDQADRWHWEWQAPGQPLELRNDVDE
jgi:antitoxin (DNA-binding transcriptional repressor) of toxin-antitoxin stability system